MFRKFPDCVSVTDSAQSIIDLIQDADFGVSLSVTSLVTSFAQASPDAFLPCIDVAVEKLKEIVFASRCKPEYVYYKVPVPWLQVKLLRLLQY